MYPISDYTIQIKRYKSDIVGYQGLHYYIFFILYMKGFCRQIF